MNNNRILMWFRGIKLPRCVVIAACVLPVFLTALFYALRPVSSIMGWASVYVSAPIRGFLGMLSSVYPFSMMEVLLTAAVIWLIYYIIKTISVTARRRGKWKILVRRVLPVLVAALYVWALFCWLWNSGYYAPGFAERNGFTGSAVTVDGLVSVTKLFSDRANELSEQVRRDEEGRYIEDRREMFAASTDIWDSITAEFPSLDGKIYRPKAMVYSWLMSRTGYSGMYFALTGEANINVSPPVIFMPATVAHEHAHQLGVYAEDEANFVSILACVTSGNAVFEYAGYLSGLKHLLNALASVDVEAWLEIMDSLSDEVIRDWQENSEFWRSQRTVNTGIGFIDSILTNVTVSVSDAVDSVYDGYLKSQRQELGLKSYGACVDLLVEYFVMRSLV